MKCDVCGLEYGLSHNCAGPLPESIQALATAEMQVPANAGLGYYLGESLKIVRWDDIAVRRNAKDRGATLYGFLFWLASMILILLFTALPQLQARLSKAQPGVFLVALIVTLVFGVITMAVLTFVQLGLCHLLAKWFFGATGKLIEVLRPLLLASYVNCLMLIPAAGMLLASIGWTAVLMIVFEEVDGIGRLQAFGISAGINVCIFVLQVAFLAPH